MALSNQSPSHYKTKKKNKQKTWDKYCHSLLSVI